MDPMVNEDTIYVKILNLAKANEDTNHVIKSTA